MTELRGKKILKGNGEVFVLLSGLKAEKVVIARKKFTKIAIRLKGKGSASQGRKHCVL